MPRLKEFTLDVAIKRPVTDAAIVQLVEGVALEMLLQLRKADFSKEDEFQEKLVVKFHVTFDRTD